MSAIRVHHESASVELEAYGVAYADGQTIVRYQAADLIHAAVRALKAADTREADDWIAAIEHGAETKGLGL